jgi:hypothetical protein
MAKPGVFHENPVFLGQSVEFPVIFGYISVFGKEKRKND